MQIHQLQASYQSDQDRILLRLNTHSGEEMRVWLTRRMLKGMLEPVQRLADHLGRQDHSQPEAEDNSAGSQAGAMENDFSTPFEDGADTTLPLGEQPLLTTALQVTSAPDNCLQVRFDEVADGQTSAQRSMEITLGPELLVGFVQVLDAVLKVADWGIALNSTLPAPKLQENTPSPMDAFAQATRPKYLN
jgi:hypothetical protein